MKKKLFISQPMRGKSDSEILADRANAIQAAKYSAGWTDDFEVIDTLLKDIPAGRDPQRYALLCLAKSLELLAEADAVFFAHGWESARGCRIEHACAVEYGIDTLFERRTDEKSE